MKKYIKANSNYSEALPMGHETKFNGGYYEKVY